MTQELEFWQVALLAMLGVLLVVFIAGVTAQDGSAQNREQCSDALYDLAEGWPASLAGIRGNQLAYHGVCLGNSRSQVRSALPGAKSEYQSGGGYWQYTYGDVVCNVRSGKGAVGIIIRNAALPASIRQAILDLDFAALERRFGPYDHYDDGGFDDDLDLEAMEHYYGSDIADLMRKVAESPLRQIHYFRGFQILQYKDTASVALTLLGKDAGGDPQEW
ncbi:hypothetical protein ACFLSF_01180 [Candidatus Bipolaricaulota bacterium]